MPWYHNFVTHFSCNACYAPPMETVERDTCMGALWKKKLSGGTFHGNSNPMSNFVYKLHSHHKNFPKGDVGLIFCRIAMSADGDGYTALCNIMWTLQPALTENKVETRIPFQGITISFSDHIAAINNHIKREDSRTPL
jgi:hypothetical protein